MQDARDRKAQQDRARHDQLLENRARVISEHRQKWNALINASVKAVLDLRSSVPHANAGTNVWYNQKGQRITRVIPGGTGNPIKLKTKGDMHGVTGGDITCGMAGFDNSDSGLFKFRRDGVLVHCC